ncbi:MAG: hypothetical protein ABEJ66_01540 [Candidatus Nanohaloarchaea archaeon]
MKLFDRISDEGEEVEIDSAAAVSGSEEQEKEESRLRNQVEQQVSEESRVEKVKSTTSVEGSKGTGTSESSGSSLPGVDYGDSDSGSGSTGSGSSDSGSSTLPGTSSTGSNSSAGVGMEEIHSQNEKIISLLEEIRSEVKDDGVL